MELLRAENVSKRLDGEVPVTLIQNVSLTIRRGEFVVITGPSGSGKSSLLYLLGLLDQPTTGEIWLKTLPTTTASDNELARLRLSSLGFVFQFHFLLPEFSALENVMLPMQRLGARPQAEITARAQELLERFKLGSFSHKLPKQLSGGQSQRVAIARALANDPDVILADEPTGSLDSSSGSLVQETLRELVSQDGRAVIVVTHDQSFAEGADRVIHVVDGKLVTP